MEEDEATQDFNCVKEKYLKINIADDKVKLSRPLQYESGHYAFTQYVMTPPSSDCKFAKSWGTHMLN